MRMTEEDYLEYVRRTRKDPLGLTKPKEEPKPNKYRAKKVTVDGLKFDSQLEADYYGQLKLLLKAGEILGFSRQARFPVGGGREYLADFIVWYPDRVEIIDTKGVQTEVFKIKASLFRERYPGLELKIVKKG
jgi:hypothetical protein